MFWVPLQSCFDPAVQSGQGGAKEMLPSDLDEFSFLGWHSLDSTLSLGVVVKHFVRRHLIGWMQNWVTRCTLVTDGVRPLCKMSEKVVRRRCAALLSPMWLNLLSLLAADFVSVTRWRGEITVWWYFYHLPKAWNVSVTFYLILPFLPGFTWELCGSSLYFSPNIVTPGCAAVTVN